MAKNPRRSVGLLLVAALLATGLSACSYFQWGAEKPLDDAGNPIPTGTDIPASQVPKSEGGDEKVPALPEASLPAAPAVTVAPVSTETASAPASPDSDSKALRKIAILPVAYRSADGGYPCDLCPPTVVMQETSLAASRLTTAFFYEQIARHPRYLTAPYKAVNALAPQGMKATATALAAKGQADAVLIAALVALRPRVGDDEHPEQPAGAALYAALVDAHNGTVLWSGTFDQDETAKNRLWKLYDEIVGGVPRRWHSAEGYTEYGVKDLVADLDDEIGD